jgi:hypothetical protein
MAVLMGSSQSERDGGVTDAVDRPLVRYSNMIYDSGRWEGFRFRDDDIVISTPPKCGTTWTQMITALLIFQTPDLPAPLAKLSPWLDMRTRARRDVVADLEAQTHRRFIKTHTPLPGLPQQAGVTYVCVARDPRDVALSMDDHVANLDFGAFFAACAAAAAADGVPAPVPPDGPPPGVDQSDEERFWAWVMDDTPPTETTSSLAVTLEHAQSFWDVRDADNVVMLHYEDLKTDLLGQMRALAERLGIEVADDLWPALTQAASFDEMRRRSSITAPNSDIPGIWLDNANFFRKGRSGAWRELLNDTHLERYDERVSTLASPELSRWMHRS